MNNTPLRIALTSEHASPLAALGGTDAGGQNVYVTNVAKSMARAGHHVDVFTRRDAPHLPGSVDICPGVRVMHIDAESAAHVPKEGLLPHMPAFGASALQSMQHSVPYSVVHANFFMSGLVGLRLRDRLRVLLVVTFHALGLVRRKHQCALRGPAVARNCGWRAARAALIAFTNDDTLPQPAWLREGVAAMTERTGWSALCGRIGVPRMRRGRPTDHELMTIGLESAQFATANAFVRRDALARIGGFDESFTRAWREDSDLQFRLMEQVGPVGKCPSAMVLHPVRVEPWGVCLRQQRNSFFDALLYEKHPRLYRARIRALPPWKYYLIVGMTLAAPLLLRAGAASAAATAAVPVVALWLQLGVARLRYTALGPAHVVEMLMTSALIPFLSVCWRVRGAIRYRVLFL